MGMDIDIIFKIAAIGIAIAVLNQILLRAGREEQAMMTTLAGIVIVLFLVVQMISEFFDTVRTTGSLTGTKVLLSSISFTGLHPIT